MTKKIKKGYDWVEEQQDAWDSIVAEKFEQLNALSHSHLEWLSKHSSVGDLLSWKRPAFDKRKAIASKERSTSQPQQIVIDIPQLTDSVKQISADQSNSLSPQKENIEFNREATQEADKDGVILQCSTPTVSEYQQSTSQVQDFSPQEKLDVAPELDESMQSTHINKGSEKAHLTANDKVDTVKRMSISQIPHPQFDAPKKLSSSSITSEENFIAHTPELVMDHDSQQTQTQKAPKTPELFAQTEIEELRGDFKLNNDKEKYDDNSFLRYEKEEFNEEPMVEEDEIQLVVSHRDSRKEDALQNKPDQGSMQLPIAQSVISPPQNVAPAIRASPVRPQSSFMSRLFHVGSAKDKSLKEDSPSPIDFVTTRPKSSTSTSTTKSETGKKFDIYAPHIRVEKRSPEPISAEIEVSDAMPEPHFKKPKFLTKKQTTNVASNIPNRQTKDSEKSEKPEKPAEQEKNEKNEEEEEIYEIPSWAQGAELHSLLINQTGLDPDAIFGRMTPLYLEEIFSKEFMTKIPEQAPP